MHTGDWLWIVSFVPKDQPSQSTGKNPMQVALFDAVRRWADEEGIDAFEFQVGGKTLSPDQIQEIAHSDDYKNRLLAFDERR
jgi:hypothetical protein